MQVPPTCIEEVPPTCGGGGVQLPSTCMGGGGVQIPPTYTEGGGGGVCRLTY